MDIVLATQSPTLEHLLENLRQMILRKEDAWWLKFDVNIADERIEPDIKTVHFQVHAVTMIYNSNVVEIKGRYKKEMTLIEEPKKFRATYNVVMRTGVFTPEENDT